VIAQHEHQSDEIRIVARADLGPELVAELKAWRADSLAVEVLPERGEDAPFLARLSEADVLLHVLNPVTADMMARAPRLRLIQKIGVGVNTIDLEEAARRGIAVCNMPGTNTAAVAEMTIALMFAALRRLAEFDRAARRSVGWRLEAGCEATLGEIAGRTVGLVGAGAVARRVAGVLAALEANVVYWNRTRQPDFPGRFLEKEELLASSDIVSLHIPLTQETSRILDRNAIARLKPGAILVNTARGGLVEEPALIESLRQRRIAAAALDVLAVEPPDDDHPLLHADNVIVTPHIAWLTRETWRRSLAIAHENVLRLARGAPLLHRVV
jgi:phosphoglycerate dehydrogenase-like enzyme